MELENDRFVLSDVLETGLAIVRERSDRRRINVRLDIDRRIGVIEGDERKVRQVDLNLLSNALKFTPEGGRVDVVARPVGDEVQVAVRDNGIGVRREDQARIFEPFRQAEQGPRQVREGTGLGLSLAKEFVELHGGRIWLESEVRAGSTFTFALPLRLASVDVGARSVSTAVQTHGG